MGLLELAAEVGLRKSQARHASFALISICLFAVSSASAVSLPEVWITHREDGQLGSGHKSDPFNGSDPVRLGSLLRLIPPRTTIHFGEGVFLTSGIEIKEGWRISGAGKTQTTLKLIPGALRKGTPGSERCVLFHFDFQGFLHDVELSNLTLDCNRAAQPAFQKNLRGYSLDAWVIASKNARITGVRAVGTWANPGEGFPCRVQHDGSRDGKDRIVIEGCENVHPLGYLTAISVFDQAGGWVAGRINHCTVTDHAAGAAFGAGGWRHFQVDHNRVRNTHTGITIDTHDYVDVEIAQNKFRNCLRGILCNGMGVYRDIRIHDNCFELAANAPAPCIDAGSAHITGSVIHNTVIQRSRTLPILSQGPGTKMTVRGNSVRKE